MKIQSAQKLFATLLVAVVPAAWGAPTVTVLTNGTSWSCPANVTSVKVECWGGGGAGGSAFKANAISSYAGGGAGGAYARRASVLVTPLASYSYSVGGGGVNSSGIDGTRVSGTNTTFTGDNSITITATGGQGGASAIGNTRGAAGLGSTLGCVGDDGAVFAGGDGAVGNLITAGVGGGGGGGET